MTAPDQASYDTDDPVWCARCKRPESVGAVLHDGPYTLANSRSLVAAGALSATSVAR
jgi:hypothetical protein